MLNTVIDKLKEFSKEDFPVPEIVTIPLDCENLNIESSKKKKDLEDLGF